MTMRHIGRKSLALLLALLTLVGTLWLPAAAEEVDTSGATEFVFSDEGITVTEGDYDGYKIEGCALTLNDSGTYVVSGTCADGSIKVKKGTQGVVLVLSGLTLTASDTAPIACNKSTEVTIVAAAGTVNTLTDSALNNDDEYPDNESAESAVIKCKDGSQVRICGTGTLNVLAYGKNGVKGGASTEEEGEASLTVEDVTLNITATVNDGLKSDQQLNLLSGTITVSAADDGIKSDLELNIGALGTAGPTILVSQSNEGIEAATLNIYSGDITVHAEDDGINAANSDLTGYSFTCNLLGGKVYVDAQRGDGIDSNGTLTISDGVVTVFSSSQNDNAPLDSERGITLNGGTVLAVGASGMGETPSSAQQPYLTFGSGGMMGGMTMGGTEGQSGTQGTGRGGRNRENFNGSGMTLPNATDNGMTFPAGMTPPEGLALPEGLTPPEGLTLPEGLTPPEGLTLPEGMTPPEGLTLPEGLTPPEGLTLPEGLTPPEGLTLPEGMTPPEGLTSPENSTGDTTTSGIGAWLSQTGTGSAVSLQAGDTLKILDGDGNLLYSAEALRAASYVFFTSPEVEEGETYTLQVNGTAAATATATTQGGGTGLFGGGQRPSFPGSTDTASSETQQPSGSSGAAQPEASGSSGAASSGSSGATQPGTASSGSSDAAPAGGSRPTQGGSAPTGGSAQPGGDSQAPQETAQIPGEEEGQRTAEQFRDVSPEQWFYPAVQYVLRQGLMAGTSEGTFSPDLLANRAMAAMMLYHLAGDPESSWQTVFSDVSQGSWYDSAVLWAYQNGVLSGYPDGSFHPEETITREQLAVMLYQYSNVLDTQGIQEDNLSAFSDGDSVSPWALEAMHWAVAAGVFQGDDTGKLNPQAYATRAQLAQIFMNCFQ